MSRESANEMMYGKSSTFKEIKEEDETPDLPVKKTEHRPPPIKMRVIFQIKYIQICTNAHLQDI